MKITRFEDAMHFDFDQTQLHKIEIKLASIEDRIDMQIKSAIIKWVGDKMDTEDAKNKPKPYYRKGRWE